ncbi:MAG: hypothetical protein JNL08_05085 [Planctomycetes bacterium]|nr:hypothetical protein [Planctomycetota bacterium]
MRSHSRRSQDGGARPLAAVGQHASLVLPALLVVVSALVLADSCRQQLTAAAAARPTVGESLPLVLLLFGFALAGAALVVVQAGRVAARVAGPERRLVEALRRMREGDLSFRVQLRRGDPLGAVARECNALLDWLNANPPAGARTGGDIVDVDLEPVGEDAP